VNSLAGDVEAEKTMRDLKEYLMARKGRRKDQGGWEVIVFLYQGRLIVFLCVFFAKSAAMAGRWKSFSLSL
jgi:hypothetical protein